MPDCPLADDCPSFSERIEGLGCQHYGDRGGAEWCNHYNQPISDLKQQPVKPGEEIVVDVTDIHESGAGVGRTEDGFIVMVDGILPETRARVRVTQVKHNHAQGEEVERLPDEDADEGEAENADAETDVEADADAGDDATDDSHGRPERERLGSRENFWGS